MKKEAERMKESEKQLLYKTTKQDQEPFQLPFTTFPLWIRLFFFALASNSIQTAAATAGGQKKEADWFPNTGDLLEKKKKLDMELFRVIHCSPCCCAVWPRQTITSSQLLETSLDWSC